MVKTLNYRIVERENYKYYPYAVEQEYAYCFGMCRTWGIVFRKKKWWHLIGEPQTFHSLKEAEKVKAELEAERDRKRPRVVG